MKLSEKYRPQDDQLLIGEKQRKAYEVLTGKHHQIVTFTGSSGTGKTTLGKIYASYLLNCEMDKLNQHPAFQHVDSRSVGVAYFKEQFIEKLYEPNMYSKYKVYLIDETHSLKSASEQRLLLTILEALPEHVVIIFTTDQPELLNKPLLSRLTSGHFRLTVPTLSEMRNHMLNIFGKEGVQLEGKVVEGATRTISTKDANNIYKSAQGNIRTLLDLMDSWIDGYFEPILDSDDENDDFVKAMMSGLTMSEAFGLMGSIQNYNSVLHGLCGFAISVLSRESNSKKAHIANKILLTFGKGLNQIVAEKVAFGQRLAEFYNLES